jgi:hypothetical protein
MSIQGATAFAEKIWKNETKRPARLVVIGKNFRDVSSFADDKRGERCESLHCSADV